jgi:hypothetical protein
VDVLAETEDCRVLSAGQYTPHTGCRDLYLGAASSPSQLLIVTAIVYGVLEPTVVARVYIQSSVPRSESLHVKGFCF